MKKEELKETFEAALQEMRSYQQFFKESQTELLRQLQEVMQQNDRKAPPLGNGGLSNGMRQIESQCDRFTSAGTTEWAIDLLGKLPVKSIRQRMLMHATLFEIADSRGEARVASFHAWAILEGLAGELIFPLVSSKSDSVLDMSDWLMPLFEKLQGWRVEGFKVQLQDPSSFHLKVFPSRIFRVTKSVRMNEKWENGLPSEMVFLPAEDIRVTNHQVEAYQNGGQLKFKIRATGLDWKEVVNGSTGGILVPNTSLSEDKFIDVEECVFVMIKAPRLHVLSVVGDYTNYKVGFGKGSKLEVGEKTESPWLSNNTSGPWWFRLERTTYPLQDELAEVWKVKRVEFGWRKGLGFDGIEIGGVAPWNVWYAKPVVTWLQNVTKGLMAGQRLNRQKNITPSELTNTMYKLRNQHAHNSVHPDQELGDVENLKEQFEAEWGDTIRYLCENWPSGKNCALKSMWKISN